MESVPLMSEQVAGWCYKIKGNYNLLPAAGENLEKLWVLILLPPHSEKWGPWPPPLPTPLPGALGRTKMLASI